MPWNWAQWLLTARKVLSLSVEEFWRTTPAALHELLMAATQPAAPPVRKTKYADVAGW